MVVPQTEVIIRRENTVIARYVLPPGEYTIGRDQTVEIKIEGVNLVSRQHARLTINYNEVLLEDLGSSNGTTVNGTAVTEVVKLWPGQKVQIGDAVMELRRVRPQGDSIETLGPQAAQVRRLLPDEMRGEKKYEIGKIVARGGMGAILDVREVPIRRRVAMKVMLDDSSADDIARFVEEGQVTGQLEHPNIVPVYELGVNENDQPFYTMKFVRGISLRKVLELIGGRMAETLKKYPLNALLIVLQKVCDGIAFAHSKNVIHRDLKPENVMLGEYGEALVMDWGLSKVLGQEARGRASAGAMRSMIRSVRSEEAESRTVIGTVMGTPHFMSPEQAKGDIDKLDMRTDIYALGAILYQILTLEFPVQGNDVDDLLENVKNGVIVPPSKRVGRERLPHLPGGRVPDSLSAVAMKALALDPEQRYASVKAFQDELAAYQSGFATTAEKAGAWKQLKLYVRRHRAVSLASALIGLLLLGFAAKLLIDRGQIVAERNRSETQLAELRKSAPAFRDLAENEAAAQRFEPALAKLDAAISLTPEYLPAYWRRAWMLVGLGRYGEAAAAVRLAKEKDPGNEKPAAILPMLDEVAAAPEAARWTPARQSAVLTHLRAAGAIGEAAALARIKPAGK